MAKIVKKKKANFDFDGFHVTFTPAYHAELCDYDVDDVDDIDIRTERVRVYVKTKDGKKHRIYGGDACIKYNVKEAANDTGSET